MRWIELFDTGEKATVDSTLYGGKGMMPVRIVGYEQTNIPMLLTSYQRTVLPMDLRVEDNSSYWGEL